MAHIFGFERSQFLLLPETVDDYVGSDNPVRALLKQADIDDEGPLDELAKKFRVSRQAPRKSNQEFACI